MRNVRLFAGFIMIAASFMACSKEINGNHAVRIQLDNRTSLAAIDAIVNGKSYGTVKPGETSACHSLTKLGNTPSVSFYSDITQVLLVTGYCGNSLPAESSYLESGDYVYTLTTDTTAYYGCTYSFTKGQN